LFITFILGASLISSVFGLNDNPQILIVFHFKSGIIFKSLSTTLVFCFLFTFSVDDIISKLYQNSFQVSIRACTSFGKQLHPYHIPA
jgi:hypothetical protein